MPKFTSAFNRNRFYVALYLSVTILIYYFLHLRYWIYYVDDSWTLTYVYAYIFYGLDMDLVFRPETSDRVFLYFGKTYHFLYGHLLNYLGWTKGNSLLISTCFMFMNAFLWYIITGVLGFSKRLRLVTAFSLLLFPAFFSSANMARPDSMTLFLILLTFLMFIKEFYFPAGFFMLMAFETHLMGLVSSFYIIAYVIYRKSYYLSDKKKLIRHLAGFFAGILTGAAYYFFMHCEQFEFDKILKIILENRTMSYPISNYIVAYFFNDDFYRHIPEFIFVIVSLFLYIKKKYYRDNKFVLIFALSMLISTLITKRPNGNYMLFVYPGILLVVFYTYEKLGVIKKVAQWCFIYFILQYLLIYVSAYGFNFEEINRQTRSYLTDQESVVVGMPDNWFAAMDRTFYPIYPSAKDLTKKEFNKAYLIKNDYISKSSRNYYDIMKYFESNFDMVRIARFKAYQDNFVEIYKCSRKIPYENR